MPMKRYPTLYQVNSRTWTHQFQTDLDGIPDGELDRLADLGIDWLYLLMAWQCGEAGRQVSLSHQEWFNDTRELKKNLTDDDIWGSGFAVTGYIIDRRLGKPGALSRLRNRLHKRGMLLMLDFVPNHVGLDHPWVIEHPEFFIHGDPEKLSREPQNYIRLETVHNSMILAHGRDPNFSGWPDTLQLNYGDQKLQEAMIAELMKISEVCDGVRCDMAMLLEPEVFKRTWEIDSKPFWPEAIHAVKEHHPNFVFMAEVYWDMEWQMQQAGFDYTYDKRLYDRLLQFDVEGIRKHFWAEYGFQEKLVRFLENHDEARVVSLLSPEKHKAAAVICFLCPGLRFLHMGQLDGFEHKISVHLGSGLKEEGSREIRDFYGRLLAILKLPLFGQGRWQLLDTLPAWDDNTSNLNFIAFFWSDGTRQALVIVNYSDHVSQCAVRLPLNHVDSELVRVHDLLNGYSADRKTEDLINEGFFLNRNAWEYNVFQIDDL